MKYKPAYVLAGVAAVVALTLLAALVDPAGKTPLYVGTIAPILLLFGVLGYQWVWAGRQGAPPSAAVTEEERRDAGRIADHWRMYEVLATGEIDPEAMRRARRATSSLVRDNVKLGAIVALLPVAAAVMVATQTAPDFGSGAFLVLVPLVLAPAALFWVRTMMARAAETGADMMAPLGLRMTAMPRVGIENRFGSGTGHGTRVEGATVLEGDRMGHAVRIELGSAQTTSVAARVPPFRIEPEGERLVAAAETPAPVRELLAGLGPSPRWGKLRRVEGGAGGIVIERKVDADNGWMWDLWLAERLAEALEEAR